MAVPPYRMSSLHDLAVGNGFSPAQVVRSMGAGPELLQEMKFSEAFAYAHQNETLKKDDDAEERISAALAMALGTKKPELSAITPRVRKREVVPNYLQTWHLATLSGTHPSESSSAPVIRNAWIARMRWLRDEIHTAFFRQAAAEQRFPLKGVRFFPLQPTHEDSFPKPETTTWKFVAMAEFPRWPKHPDVVLGSWKNNGIFFMIPGRVAQPELQGAGSLESGILAFLGSSQAIKDFRSE